MSNHTQVTPPMGNQSSTVVLEKYLQLSPADREIVDAAIDAMSEPDGDEERYPRLIFVQWEQANSLDTVEAWGFVEGIMFGLYSGRPEIRKDVMFLFSLALERKALADREAVAYGKCLFERNRCHEELHALTEQFGYALESISQLVELSIEKGHKRDVAVTTAQRFLREIKGGAL